MLIDKCWLEFTGEYQCLYRTLYRLNHHWTTLNHNHDNLSALPIPTFYKDKWGCLIPYPVPPFQVSYSDWPRDIFHSDFYKAYILGRPYDNHYSTVQHLDPANSSDVDLLIAERLVKNNFLSMYILRRLRMQELHVTEKYSLASYLSQLGEALNLWAGITVVVVVELIELLYYCVAGKRGDSVAEWW